MPEKTFCSATRYGAVRDRLKAAWKALDEAPTDQERLNQAIADYQDYLDLVDHAFPMLLSVGEPLTLERAPSGTYLLPPIAGTPLRYLICLFPRTPGQKAGLRLFEWRPDLAGETQPLRDFGDVPSPVVPVQRETPVDFPGCRMAELPSRITPLALHENMAVFMLVYRNGSLTVMANRQPGPSGPQIQVTWSPQSESAGLPRAERVSGADMPVALFIQRRTDDPEHWPDDQLLDSSGQLVVLDDPKIGRIDGVDGPADAPLRYLASNLARVFRVNLETGEVRRSARLGGKVEDILVIEKRQTGSKRVVLAACYDGRVYWLEDDADESRPKIRHWQPMPRLHIQRLVGDTQGNIIALDQYYRLHPLRLNDVCEVKILRDRATETITCCLHKAKRLYRFLVEENGLAAGRAPDPRRFRLLVEVWLRAIQRHETVQTQEDDGVTLTLGYLDEVARDLGRAISADISSERALQIAGCHEALLRRIWGWMRNQVDGHRGEQPLDDPLRVLRTTAALCDLPEAAPDRLWLKVFREYDWLQPWGQCLGLHKDPYQVEYRRLLDLLHYQVDRQRRVLAARSYPLRSLTEVNSLRLGGQVHHLRCLNRAKQSFVCFVPSRGLSAFIRTENPVPHWEQYAELDGVGQGLWRGQIGAVATRVDSEDGKQSPDLVLIATNQGEALLFAVQDGRFCLQGPASVRVPIDCYSARYLRLNSSVGPRRGFLLGGNDPRERACLVWLGLDSQQRLRPPQVLYTSDGSGRLRLVQEEPDAKAPRRVWAIDQIGGLLLCWSLDPLLRGDSPGTLTKPTIWYRSVSELHALYLSTLADPPQAVCGGHDGSVVALSRRCGEEGRLLWSTGCGAAIRRIRRIRTGDDQAADGSGGLWLVAGDSEDAMLLDDQGRLMAALERVGPVSATCRLATGKAVIAAQSGRLLFLEGGSPRPPVDNRQGLGSIAVYPLRAQDRLAPPELQVMADLFNSDEPLIAQRGLRLIADALGRNALTDAQIDVLERASRLSRDEVAAWDRRYPPHRPALLARRPDFSNRVSFSDTGYHPGLDRLLTRLWEGLAERSESDVLGQIVDGILAVSEPAALTGDPFAQVLTARIGNCLWGEPPRECPRPIAIGGQLRLLRLSQAARAWQAACAQDPISPTPVWAQTLALLWGTDDPRCLGPRFAWLAYSRLPFEGFVDRQPWLDLLGSHKKPAALAKLGLTALQAYSRETVLTDADISRVSAVFPDNHHWGQWLKGLADLVRQVRDAHGEGPGHFAWQERERLLSLGGQVDGAESVLTAKNGLTLAGLFWQGCRDAWTGPIALRLQALDEGMADPDLSAYLDVETRFTWRDDQHIEVRLRLRNRASRPLLVMELQGPDGLITEVKRNLSLPANDDWSEISFGIGTQTPDTLDRQVTLYCQDQLGRDYQHEIPLHSLRSLETFSDDCWWPERARHLMAHLDARRPLLWLRGPWWPDDEHERLIRLIMDRYAAAWSGVKKIASLAGAGEDAIPIWVPDLKPGEQGLDLVAQVHALLHSDKGPEISHQALAVWVHLRRDTPPRVTAALGDWIPGPQAVQSLLRRMLGDQGYRDLTDAMQGLPASFLTAWCTGAPLDDPSATARPSPGDLGLELWRRLLPPPVPSADVLDWLACRPEVLAAIQGAVVQVEALLQPGLSRLPGTALKPIAAPLLAVLAASEPGLAGDICYAQTRGADERIDLLHQTLSRVYCLLPGQTPAADQPKSAEGLWLLVARDPLPDLPGIALRLDPDDLLALLCAPNRRQVLQRLNQLAALQHRITPGRVFQTTPGLDAERMDRAFHGRTDELERIFYLLDLHEEARPSGGSPSRKNASALLVGGRRMGKTTLMQRIEYELVQRGDQRPWVELICSQHPAAHGDAVLRWFLNKLWAELNGKGERIRYEWSDVGNPRQRDEAIRRVKERLAQISHRRGHKAVLFLDETLHLLRHDAPGHAVGHLVRELVQANLISIIATTYPHGSEQGESLCRLARTNLPDNPWYNLFGDPLVLGPWSPQETWEFLQTRLDGFGILLPESLAGTVLHFCRGFPWIAHALGLALCGTAKGRRRVISVGDWERALRVCRDEVLNHLRQTVRSVAEKADEEDGIDPYANPLRAFGLQNLWDALSLQAQRRELLPIRHQDKSWPEELVVDPAEVADRFKGHVRTQRVVQILDRLTHTGVLIGSEGACFRFCNNLFPAYVRPMTDQRNGNDR